MMEQAMVDQKRNIIWSFRPGREPTAPRKRRTTGMIDRRNSLPKDALSFGPFSLFVAERLLNKAGEPAARRPRARHPDRTRGAAWGSCHSQGADLNGVAGCDG